ncbi:MAG: hypothetical protein K8T91_02195 [Planctomycetes bacterium]|nr:hypothetical protein [Planctomycetota bacterium]
MLACRAIGSAIIRISQLMSLKRRRISASFSGRQRIVSSSASLGSSGKSAGVLRFGQMCNQRRATSVSLQVATTSGRLRTTI